MSRLTTPRLWHYTIPQYLPPIIEAGGLLPATAGIAEGERPAVWFSANQRWEPTAAKMGLRTLDAMTERFGCMVRFGIAREAALPWRRLVPAVGMPESMRKALERAGRTLGASPDSWFGVIGSVPLADLAVEIFDGREWEPPDAAVRP